MEVWVDENCIGGEPRGSSSLVATGRCGSTAHLHKGGPLLVEDKENLDPCHGLDGGLGFGRRHVASRSPLPMWYPRRPLQDITLISNALQGFNLDDDNNQLVKTKLHTCNMMEVDANKRKSVKPKVDNSGIQCTQCLMSTSLSCTCRSKAARNRTASVVRPMSAVNGKITNSPITMGAPATAACRTYFR